MYVWMDYDLDFKQVFMNVFWKDPTVDAPKEGNYLCACRIFAGSENPPGFSVSDFWYNPRKGWIGGSLFMDFEVIKYISISDIDKVTDGEIEKLKLKSQRRHGD